MLNKLIKFFLLKNSLFLKIILVFTLPAIGILYFSTVLVYEKINTLSEISYIQKNIKYVTLTQKLIRSLQNERGRSIIYLNNNKYEKELLEVRKRTTIQVTKYLEKIDLLDEKTNELYIINKAKHRLEYLSKYRTQVNEKNISSFIIMKNYSEIIEQLLDSIYSIKPVSYATEFNNKFSYIVNLLFLKENTAVERGYISSILSSKKLDDEFKTKLIEIHANQDLNKKKFLIKANEKEVLKYESEVKEELENQIFKIRKKLQNDNELKNIDINIWWDISSQKIDALERVYEYILVNISKLAVEIENEAYLAQILSLTFLLVSFLTLISLLFVLRGIISNEQKSVNKIKKQQDVYSLLNKTNKFLLKSTNEKKLFNKICQLVVEDSSMAYGFIYKINKDETAKLIATDSEIKKILDVKLLKENSKNDNLVTKVLKEKKNIIIDNFAEKNISLLSNVAQTYNIKSAAAFPIKKFNKIFSVLVLYSNKVNFFEKDIEILFDKMINDMSHSLEKIDYEKKRIEQENEIRLASYAFESSEPMIITDVDGFIINANNAFCNVMEYTKIDVIGRKPNMFKSKHQNKSFYTNMWNNLIENGAWNGEVYNTKKNKEKIPLRATITAIKDNDGKTTHYLGQYIDISDQIDRQKVLEYQATHDNLTGLPNRLLLLDRIEHAITKTTRHNIVGGLVFIDLDNFKEVNDTLGHEVGDNLLIMVAKKIKKTIRDEDTIARIGGDEFIVLADCIGNTKDEARANMRVLTNKIKDSLNSIDTIDGYKNISTPSLGVTLFSDSSISAKDIIKQADTAMYEAKKQGKNTIEFFN